MSLDQRAVLRMAAVALVFAVTGCTSSGTGPAANTAPESAPVAAIAPESSPAGLQRFYDQELAWTGCVEFATEDFRTDRYGWDHLECARLTVPLDYADPAADAPTVTLGVMRSRATAADERIGTVIGLSGSDGYGMDLAALYLAAEPGAELHRRFDIVAFDRRGVGASQPLVECLPGEEMDRQRETSTRTRTDAEVAAANAEVATFLPACLENTDTEAGVDTRGYLRHASGADTVQDLDVLRAALGEDTVSLLGYSYGGRIAAAYAAAHPDRVRAQLLDSPFLTDDAVEYARAQTQAYQAAFEFFAAWCAPVKTCPLGPDPAAAVDRYRALVLPLLDAPLPSLRNPGRVLSYDDAVGGTVVGLARDASWEDLSYALIMLSQGKPDPLLEMSDDGWWRDGRGDYHLDAETVLICVDAPPPPTGTAADELAAELDAAAPFLDSGDPARAVDTECTSWGEPPRFAESPAPDGGVTPTLVVAVRGDTAVPYSLTSAVVQELGASLLTVEGTGHIAYLLASNACVDEAGTAFLTSLVAPGPGATCA